MEVGGRDEGAEGGPVWGGGFEVALLLLLGGFFLCFWRHDLGKLRLLLALEGMVLVSWAI